MWEPRTLAVDYDVYEIAVLAGGPRRAVDAAAVALVESGRVQVDRATGGLTVTDARRSHALEAAVLDAIGIRGHRSIETVRWRVDSDERLTVLRRRPEADGLLRASAPGRRERGWQTFALTGEGRRTLRHLRTSPPADRVAEGTSAMQVALWGRGVLADAELRSALFEPPPPSRARGLFAPRRDPHAAAYEHHTDGASTVGGSDGGWDGGWGGDGGGGGGDGGG